MKSAEYHIKTYHSARFSEYIEGIRSYQFHGTKPVQLHPNGHFELIFQLHGDVEHLTSSTNSSWVKRPKQFIGGLHNQSYSIKPISDDTRIISVRIKAKHTRNFVNDHLHYFKNKVVSLDDICHRDSLAEINDLSPDSAPADIVHCIERFLKDQVQDQKPSVIHLALSEMEGLNGFVNIEKIASMCALSSPQFRKRFNAEVGMSPKEYCKILRFNSALRVTKQFPNLSLTEIAHSLGYFDQSHFIKDFKSITSHPPKALLKR